MQTVSGANVSRRTWIGGEPWLWIDGAVTEDSGTSFDLGSWADVATAAVTTGLGLDGGAATGFTVTDASGAATQAIQDNTTVVSSTNKHYEHFSIAYDAAQSGYARVGLTLSGGTTGLAQSIVIDQSDGTYNAVDTDGVVEVVERIGAFFHIVLSLTDNGTGNTAKAKFIEPAYNTDGTVTADVAATGATIFGHCGTFENNFSLMPVLSTGGTTKSVAAEVAGLTVGSWYNQASGTVLASVYSPQVVSNANRNIAVFGTTGADRLTMYRVPLGGDTQNALVSGAITCSIPGTAHSVGAQKFGYAFQANNFALYRDGASKGTDTSGAMPPALTALAIGSYIGGSIQHLYGGIKDLTYVPRRLANAEMVTRTT